MPRSNPPLPTTNIGCAGYAGYAALFLELKVVNARMPYVYAHHSVKPRFFGSYALHTLHSGTELDTKNPPCEGRVRSES